MALREGPGVSRLQPRLAGAPVRCTSCGALFDDEVWNGLRLVERLGAEEVGKLVLRWRADECVEVRCCGACGRGISARRPLPRP